MAFCDRAERVLLDPRVLIPLSLLSLASVFWRAGAL